MDRFDPASSFGPEVAAAYDQDPRGDEDVAVEFLAKLAGSGRALEFAIGTGRIALPLVERGVEVDGIELSPDMLARLRSKPHGNEPRVELGSMSLVDLGERYSLVYLVFNTIFNLITVDDQIQCFQNAARHLEPGGAFVVETALPHAWIAPGESEYVRAEHIGLDAVGLGMARYDPATQLFDESHVRLGPDGVSVSPLVLRLITPGEMDLMGRLAGLRCEERFADWRGAPFNSASRAHVSVYRRDA